MGNSPELTVIPLPSNLGVDRCRQSMAEDLIPLEMSLREGQANNALHNLRIHLCNKAILFQTTIRQAKSQALKTRAWSQVTSVQQAVSLHASIYTKTRKQMIHQPVAHIFTSKPTVIVIVISSVILLH